MPFNLYVSLNNLSFYILKYVLFLYSRIQSWSVSSSPHFLSLSPHSHAWCFLISDVTFQLPAKYVVLWLCISLVDLASVIFHCSEILVRACMPFSLQFLCGNCFQYSQSYEGVPGLRPTILMILRSWVEAGCSVSRGRQAIFACSWPNPLESSADRWFLLKKIFIHLFLPVFASKPG